MIKKEVRIAELKAHLSEYLRAAQAGQEVIIKDRNTPIARLAPLGSPEQIAEENLRAMGVKFPTKPVSEIDKLHFFRPKGLKPGDVMKALREVRKDRF